MMYTYEGLYYRITSNNTKSIDIITTERFQFLGCQIDSRPAKKNQKSQLCLFVQNPIDIQQGGNVGCEKKLLREPSSDCERLVREASVRDFLSLRLYSALLNSL